MRIELLEKLCARLVRWILAGDAAAILDQEATGEASDLLASIDWASIYDDKRHTTEVVQALSVVSTLHLLRAEVVPSDEAADEVTRAQGLYQMILELVPGPALDGDDPREQLSRLADILPFSTEAIPEMVNSFEPSEGMPVQSLTEAIRESLGNTVTTRRAESLADKEVTARRQVNSLGASADIDAAEEVFERYRETLDSSLLPHAIQIYEDRLRTLVPGGPEYYRTMAKLGSAKHAYVKEEGSIELVDDCIATLRKAIASTPIDDSELPNVRCDLGNALLDLYERTGREQLLCEALAEHRWAASRDASSPTETARRSISLASTLTRVFERSGDGADLDEAISLCRDAVDGTSAPIFKSAGLNALGSALTKAFEARGDKDALDESIESLRQARDLAVPGSHSHAISSSNLGNCLLRRFENFGQTADLDAAIEILRQANEFSARRHPSVRTSFLATLGFALLLRAQNSEDTHSLRECTDLLKQVIDEVPANHPERPTWLMNLGGAFLYWHNREGDVTHLSDAVAVYRKAVANASEEHWNFISMKAGLAAALIQQSMAAGNFAASREAAEIYRECLDKTPEGHPYRMTRLFNLGRALFAWAHAPIMDSQKIVEAQRALEEAVKLCPAHHPQRAKMLSVLGVVLLTRFQMTSGDDLRRRAFVLLKEGAAVSTAPAMDRLVCALVGASATAARGDFREATSAYATGVSLLDLAAWRGMARMDRERVLKQFTGFTNDAAAAAIRAGRPELAVELLEQGRGILLNQMLEGKSKYDTLREHAPELADRLAVVHSALENPNSTNGDASLADRQIRFARERESILAEVRDLPGFGDFLRPQRFEVLRLAAWQGSVVIINTSQYGCHALVVTMSGVEVLALDKLDVQTIKSRAVEFNSALERLQCSSTATQDSGLLDKALEARGVLTDIFKWCWTTIVHPILDHLDVKAPPEPDGSWPRLWWCPTGLLSFLPLHAAGLPSSRNGDVPNTVLDRVVSSYTPTLRTLMLAWERKAATSDDGVPLVAAMPSTPEHADLPAAELEKESFLRRFPHAKRLSGPEVTREMMLVSMTQSPWVHFAGHGIQDLTAPAESRLLLHDGHLTVTEIGQLHLERADLAFLSACETSRGSSELPDELISIASAMRIAGFRHVVGTLWSVSDSMAHEIADDFYHHLVTEGSGLIDSRRAAEALHLAVRKARKKWPHAPARWVPYVHIGP
ncbi:CHAT domain-containing protein [Actinomadura luteofluorescens]|uniref:CHAT domain-containing protein n=1 Tax=Actinomadura luteofluorescens TaxID=46163 RepID=UPI0030CA6910